MLSQARRPVKVETRPELSIEEVIEEEKSSLPVDVVRVARRLRIVVEERDLPMTVSGLLIKREEGFAIQVNIHHSENRRRFTIAHEIAHFVLHSELFDGKIEDDALYRSETFSGALETQANNYAAELLMPRKMIKRRYSAHCDVWKPDELPEDVVVEKMAAEFGVSNAAMRIRIDFVIHRN